MTGEEHGRQNGTVGTPGARTAVQEVSEAAGDEATVRQADAAGDGVAAGDSRTVDARTVDDGVATGEIADTGAAAHGAGADDARPGRAPSGSIEDDPSEARRAAQEHLDRALRAQAELENVRRRMARDIENAHKFALERFVSELLPVRDSLELGLAAAAEAAADEGASAAHIAEGVELTLRMFEQAMDKFGIRSIDPAGEPFDPEFHQAMTMQESDAAESGTVLNVVQKGYLLNGRLVRPAMVIVAK